MWHWNKLVVVLEYLSPLLVLVDAVCVCELSARLGSESRIVILMSMNCKYVEGVCVGLPACE